jgi:DNA-binding PadR family transcriptional regulator
MTPLRLTQATSLILRAMALGHRHGFEIMQASGLPSGTVYPALRRLESWAHVVSEWEDEDRARASGRPRRRLYALTPSGRELAVQAEERLRDAARLLGRDEPSRGVSEA